MDQEQIEALAAALGVKRNTIFQWRHRRSVPHRWRLPILAEARRRKVKLSPEELESYGA